MLPKLPKRYPPYHRGKSTPRPLRLNDRLWADFTKKAGEAGYSAPDAIKLLMESYIQKRIRPSRHVPKDIVITVSDSDD